MTTKNLSFEYSKTSLIIPTSNAQYCNLNLYVNQNYECAFKENLSSKRVTTDDKEVQNYDSTTAADSKVKQGPWNKANNYLKSDFLNVDSVEKRREFAKESKSINNSTLSLHIAAYENFVDSDLADLNDFENEGLKQKKGKLSLVKNLKTLMSGSSSNNKNLFEFPRQRKNVENKTPEVAQFKASQTLLNPTKMQFRPSPINDALNNHAFEGLPLQPEIVKQRLRRTLGLLVSSNEFVSVSTVVQYHDKSCNVPFDLMVYEKKFQSYVEIFERFPDDFIISGDRLKVAFKKNPSMPKPVLSYSDDIGQCSNVALNKKDLRPQFPMPSFIPNVGSISNAAHKKKALLSPLPVLSFTHNVGFYSNIKRRAWSSTIYVRKLLTNEVIDEPLKTTKFSETPIPQQILLNLKKMNIYRLTCIQRYILPYLFSLKTDILIEGTKFTGRTTGVIASLLSQIYIYKNSVRTHKRGPIAVILLQSSPYQCNETDTAASAEYANRISKILRLISEHLDIKIGFDSIDTSKDISVVTFKDIHEYEKKILSDLKYFVAFNVEKIIAKVGHEVFVARIEPFVPNYAVSVFVMEEYRDPGPILLQECFKPDTVFISDKS